MENKQNSLTTEQNKKIVKWLEEKTSKKGHKCEVCSNDIWQVLNQIVTPLIYSEKIGILTGSNTIPQFIIMCTNCGLIKHFSAVYTNIVNNKE